MSETGAGNQIERLPDEDFQRVLCVVAHPDDVEYGSSAAVAAWTARGVEVSYLLLTAGEAGMQIPPAQVVPLRAAEQEQACEIVGVQSLQILDFPDGMLTPSLDVRKAIARVVRQVKPDAVLTLTWELEFPGGLNHADHRVTGLAVVDALRDADNTWVFSELAAAGLPKWGTRWLLVAGHSHPNYGVPLDDDAVAKGVDSLAAHQAYLAALPNHPKPADFMPERLAVGGKAMGVAHAMVFRAFDLRGRPAGPE